MVFVPQLTIPPNRSNARAAAIGGGSLPYRTGRRVPPDITRALADIDRHVRRVAVNSGPRSEVGALAYAIHNLIAVVERLDRSLIGGR